MVASIDVTEESAEIASDTIFIKRWIPASAEIAESYPVILLHDSLGCVDMWRQFPRALAGALARPVIAYDRLGYGRSSARRELPSARFVRDEADIGFSRIKAYLQLGDFAVLGHSVGGAIAVVIAAMHARQCRAVITEATQAFVEQKTLAAIAAAKSKFADPLELVKLARYHGEKAGWVVRAWTDTWLSPEFAEWNLRAELAQMFSPLLAIQGDRDEYGSDAFPTALAGWAAGYSEKLILNDCGHVPHRERQDHLIDAVRVFLDARA